ncbi:hypothetical protein [Nitrincola sp.]|uniref:capsular polysaccharide export protein, LipB/KpsS family n=1 Tax=Nitrincola sp. TaxID=1926584 RepID=UPI003A90ACD4
MPSKIENLIICTDLNQPFIYGTFLEVLYRLENENPGNNSACLIIGDAHKHNLTKITKLITEEIGISKEKISIYAGISSLSKPQQNEVISFSTEKSKEINSCKDLSSLTYKHYNLGVPILSNLISKTRCINPDINEHRYEITAYIKYSLFTYLSFKNFNTTNKKYTHYYIYNGRHYNTFPISTITPKNTTLYYERFNYRKKLCILPHRIHDFIQYRQSILELWNSSDLNKTQKESIAHDFFEKHTKNKYAQKFTDSRINFEKKFIAFFISSEDEFASLHPEISVSHIFKNQRDAVAFMANWAEQQDEYDLILRVHPHYEEKSVADRDFWNGFSGKNVITIPSHSEISSYNLMSMADKVVSFLSTTGIEATYLGRPSILLGNSPYKGQGATYEPATIEELSALLKTNIEPLPQSSCLPYGFYIETFGYEFEFLKSLGLKDFSELDSHLSQMLI